MKKILFLFLLFIIACTVTENTADWKTGTQGLVMSYESGEPKTEYLSNQRVKVTVNYENKGTAIARNINFWLTSFDESILGFTNLHKIPANLGGKTQDNPEGYPSRYVEWETTIDVPSPEIDSFDQVVSVVACYEYSTEAEGLVCLEPDTRNPKCDFSVKNIGTSQGAPIAITQVKRQISTDEIIVEIYLENKGGGNPILGSDCKNPDIRDINVIDAPSVMIGGVRKNPRIRLSCVPSKIRLENNKGYTICRGNFNQKTQTEEQIYVDFNYRYRQKMSDKKITILNP